jgi:hypothetical protein
MMLHSKIDVNATVLMPNGLFDVGNDPEFGQTQIAID